MKSVYVKIGALLVVIFGTATLFQNCAGNSPTVSSNSVESSTSASAGGLTSLPLTDAKFWFDGVATPAPQLVDGNLATIATSWNAVLEIANVPGVSIEAKLANGPDVVRAIRLHPRVVNGRVVSFPIRYQVYVQDTPTTTHLIDTYGLIPDAKGYVEIPLPTPTRIWGLLIGTSVVLMDERGAHYLQLAEIQALR